MRFHLFYTSQYRRARRWALVLVAFALIAGSISLYRYEHRIQTDEQRNELAPISPPSASSQSTALLQNELLAGPASEISPSAELQPTRSPARPTWTALETIDQSIAPIEDDLSYALRRRLVMVEEMELPIIIEDVIETEQSNIGPQFLTAYVANRLLVKTTKQIDELLAGAGVNRDWRFIRPVGIGDYKLIETSELSLQGLQSAEAALVKIDPLARIEKDIIYYATVETIPNDPDFGKDLQWGLSNPLGNGFDINAPEGWTLRSDSTSTVVAIIDSGANLEHQDLKPNLWINETEIPDNGIDEDDNGFVDDVFGISLLDSGDPLDDNGHGTHVAGIVGARGDNGLGITGVSWKARLMTLKFLNESGRGTLSDAVEAIDYATEMGAHIINASWGSFEEANALREAIVRAGNAGIVFVAATGNNTYDLNHSFPYPASYDLENLIAVAALNKNGKLASFSNYGTRSVDIAAPGQDILSTWIGSEDAYSANSGTSMAAPFVSGILALLYSEFPDDPPALQIARLITSGKSVAALNGKIRSGKIPDLAAALAMTVVPVPPELSTNVGSVIFAEIGETVAFEAENRNESISYTTYQWFHDDTPLSGENALLLQIESSAQTAGVYRIEATNIDGSDQIQFALRVFVPQPDLAVALDFPEGEFFADSGHNWIVYEDPYSVGGTAIRKNVSNLERQDSLRLNIDGPGELRMFYRQFSQSNRKRVDVWYDGEKRRFYPDNRWRKLTLPILDPGAQTIIWKTDDSYSRPVGQREEIAFDSVVFFPADSLPPNIRPFRGHGNFREGTRLDLSFQVDYEVTQFQWLKNGSPYAITEGPFLRIENVATTDAGTYQLVATNQNGSVRSEPILVQITPGPPRFLYQGNDAVIADRNEGDRYVLAPKFVGSFELAFQWYSYNTPIPGATSPTLTLDPLTPFDGGKYRLEIWYPSNGERARSRNYWINVQPARAKPTIRVYQSDLNAIEEAQILDLNTDVEGSTPISFQWYRDNVPISEATSKDLNLENTTLSDSGTYYLIARNEFGLTRSVDMDVTIFIKPDLTELLDASFTWIDSHADVMRPEFDSELEGGSALRMEPRDQTVSTSYTLAFTASGPGTFRLRIYTAPAIRKSLYREDKLSVGIGQTISRTWRLEDGWFEIDLPVADGEQDFYVSLRREDAEYFLLDAFSLDSAPTIFQPPLDATTEIGKQTRYQVVASGQGDLAYQWYKDGSPIQGATSSEYVIPSTSANDQGVYYVTASNEEGTVTSVEATLTTIEDLETLLNLDGVVITSGGDAAWSLLLETLTLSSGTANPEFANWIEFTLMGPTYLNFDYKGTGTSGLTLDGDWYDHLDSYQEWDTMSVSIPAGIHTVRIEYYTQPEGTPPFLVRNLRTDNHTEFTVHPIGITTLSEISEHALTAELRGPIPTSYTKRGHKLNIYLLHYKYPYRRY